MDITIIGLGGIGSILCERLARFLNYSRDLRTSNITLVDGDEYEDKNYERQEFQAIGNKARTKSIDLKMQFPNLNFTTHEVFVTEAIAADIIKEGSVVLLCVDNHKTRMIISNYCKKLKNVTLISGGNDFIDGNVQIYVRRGGEDLSPDLCAYHPEIANPEDKLPSEMSCEELSNSSPQLYFANLGAATLMCWAFYNVVVKEVTPIPSEVYFDISTMSVSCMVREVK